MVIARRVTVNDWEQTFDGTFEQSSIGGKMDVHGEVLKKWIVYTYIFVLIFNYFIYSGWKYRQCKEVFIIIIIYIHWKFLYYFILLLILTVWILVGLQSNGC